MDEIWSRGALLGLWLCVVGCGGKSFTSGQQQDNASPGGVSSSGVGGTSPSNTVTPFGVGGEYVDASIGSSGNVVGTGGTSQVAGSTESATGGVSSSDTGSGGMSSVNGSTLTGGQSAGGVGARTLTFGERPNTTYRGVTYDTDLSKSTPTYNYGNASEFGCSGDQQRVSLVKFNTAGFDAKAVVVAARLHLWTAACSECLLGTGTVVQVFRMNQYWQETAFGSAVGEGGIPNWTEADIQQTGAADTVIQWLAPGAQPPSREATELGHFSATMPDADCVVSLPASLAQKWLDDPASNYGVALTVSSSSAAVVTFVSSDGNSEKSPLLEVDISN